MDEYLLPLSEAENNYCIQHGLHCYIRTDAFHIHSKHDFWRILPDEQSGKPTLYHRNKYLKKRSQHSRDPMYHPQNTKAKGRLGMLKYIVRHDRYLEKEEEKRLKEIQPMLTKKTKAARKRRNKESRRKRCQSIKYVLALLEEQEAIDSSLRI